jgi:hypothetical protein
MQAAKSNGVAGRVFVDQTERVAAAWRRSRHGLGSTTGETLSLLDSVVESFIREIGRTLQGDATPAWSRTRGTLRVSSSRGAPPLLEELTALRRCLLDALDVLGGSTDERVTVRSAINEAISSVSASCNQFADPEAPPPTIPFGGIVVEYFEPPAQTLFSSRSDRQVAEAGAPWAFQGAPR